ncbi:Imm32 family immunity protein [Streptomyces triticiradicis]|uniref:Uncharacterized protein n=1 Tax=Streptomyces triticiradicis TaxID=2651189 RepID=A0A7J5DF08_9ACTN|nr:hypothetical protein [Streptomyces triticiradicis]KAB1987461.1 hypothetical protein F8144_17195 [Streptomyces triticiradicis]
MTQSNLRIRYSGESSEVEISGSVNDLEELANVFTRGGILILPPHGDDPFPYSDYLSGLRVQQVQRDRVTISVDEQQRLLDFTGSRESVAVLAGNLRDLCREGGPGEHLHVEYFPDHFYLAESPVSLVFSRTG